MCILFRFLCLSLPCFFYNDPATTEISTLSLHDALPISVTGTVPGTVPVTAPARGRRKPLADAVRRLRKPGPCDAGDWHRASHQRRKDPASEADRKSTRLNSSHTVISYAVFCLKKKRETR